MYSLMTVRELQAELRRRNASVARKKAHLIERLEAYDRNENFGGDLDIPEDHVYVCPPSDTFRDINADSPLPNISKHEIQEYFQRFNTHPKGQLLYESRHLVTARYSSDGVYTYLKGQCKASMKKVAYVVDAKVTQEGVIEECHCECAAGSGTSVSCKHVAVLLLSAHDIVNNKTIKLHQVCTQELMMFNKPKKVFHSSPIAAQKLPNKRVASCNYEPLKQKDIMENYDDYVRNLAIGYGESSMPILQTYEPANPHGIEWDHSYSNEERKNKLLEKLYLTNITAQKIKDIEAVTRAQDASEEWHELRKCRITASMFYVVCHSTTAGKTSLAQKIISPQSIKTRAITHGKVQELVAIEKYMKETGLAVQQCGLFISKEFPFLAASPDGLIGEDTVVEVKCPYTSRYSQINEITVPYLENINGDLHLKRKHPYYAQIQGQLYCTGRKYCNLIVYSFIDMKVMFINKDNSYIHEMLPGLINFYVHHLEPEIYNKYLYRDYLFLIKNTNDLTNAFYFYSS